MQHKSVEVPFDMKFSYACEMHVFFQNYNITHFVDLIDKKACQLCIEILTVYQD